ncbi:MAG: UDP-N-acetylglucosamine pyrophosphorylase [Clostridia bacterium]|nr:UDP-N-acetylglucosamine pyrophosphorylase [Clostridia bacterium]
MDNVKVSRLFDLTHTAAGAYLADLQYPWEALDRIGDIIKAIGCTLASELYVRMTEDVWVSKSATVAPTAFIGGPAIIGHGTEIRHGAFIRGNALIGEGCVVGNSTELKNCILFDGVQVPHYNYVGDSILGYKAHLGAGAITSNVKSDKSLVEIRLGDGARFSTGRKKVGAMLGDFVEIGCGAVLNPGAVIGRETSVYPLTSVRGVIPENSILKADGTVVKRV